MCDSTVHTACLGIHRHGYPSGSFVCADCYLCEAKLPSNTDWNKALGLAQKLVTYKATRVANSSQDTYASGLHRFIKFGRDRLGLSPAQLLPEDPELVVPQHLIELFVVYCEHRYKPGTVETTLTALVDWHRSKNAPTITVRNPSVKGLMDKLRRNWGPDGTPKGKAGMDKNLLRLVLALTDHLMTREPDQATLHMRDAAMLVLAFFGMLRRSEVIQLNMSDIKCVASHPHPHLLIHVKRSKTDQHGAGVWIPVAAQNGGMRILDIVSRWLDHRRRSGALDQDPVFTKWDLDKRSMSSLRLSSGQALAERLRFYLVYLKRRYPSLVLHPHSYGMHSLRRGGATAAWQSGTPLLLLMAHGRWRSKAVEAYLTSSLSQRLSVTEAM